MTVEEIRNTAKEMAQEKYKKLAKDVAKDLVAKGTELDLKDGEKAVLCGSFWFWFEQQMVDSDE